MKKQILLLFAIFFTVTSFAQIVFEKGYFINNSDERVECLIKNEDWNSNPTEFDYKRTEASEQKEATIKNVKEFGVYDASKYERFKVNIDRSSDNDNQLSDQQKPVFLEEQLFLRVLIEGKADLYAYTDGNLKRYFYSKDDSDVKQLVYKRFKIAATDGKPEATTKIGINNAYKQKLWTDLQCASISQSDAEKLDYKKSSLLRFFVKYNKCADQEFVNYEDKEKRDLFNLNIRPGVDFTSLSIERLGQFETTKYDFDNQINYRVGLEAEFILGFNKNKWAITLEPTYQSYQADATNGAIKVDYKSIDVPIGARYYLFLNAKSKFFIDAQFYYNVSVNSTVKETVFEYILDANAGSNWGIGAGYKYNDKFSVEARFLTARSILADYSYWFSDYKTFSIILGYTLF